eukprot:Skav209699  [mRNA]  locus=scaffold36:117776:119230:+ [translate_table: standard]
MQALHFRAAPAVIDTCIVSHVSQKRASGTPVNWFTDGSIMYPNTPSTSHGAYAVVLDLATTDSQRELVAVQHFLDVQNIPTLACVAAARVQGEQFILRAELQAMATIITQVGYGCIYADSHSACTMVSFALQAATWQSLLHYEHCDILLEIWEVRDTVQVQVIHIKAHQSLQSTNNLLQRYRILGNAYADLKARQAAQEMLPDFVATLTEIHADQELHRTLLRDLLDLHWQLQPLRLAASKQLDLAPQLLQQRSIQDIQSAFASWQVPFPRLFPLDEVSAELDSCVWGSHAATTVLQWLATLEWPQEGNEIGPLNKNTGVAWPELVLSYAIHQRTWLPIVRQDAQKQSRVICLGSHTQATDYATDLSEQALNLRHVVDQLVALHLRPLLPPGLPRKKICSLYLQGLGSYTQGFTLRPKMPGQTQIAKLLGDHFTGVSRSLTWLPSVDLETRDLHILDSTFEQRQSIFRRATYRARLLRSQFPPG